VLRTLRNHLLQLRPYYTMETVTRCSRRNSAAAKALFRLFAARFDPSGEETRADRAPEAEAALSAALEAVASLVDDELLRALADLLAAVQRTNYYQQPDRPVFAIKVEQPQGGDHAVSAADVRDLPALAAARGDPSTRGQGRPWRHPLVRPPGRLPYRDPGLMKTQMVKNSIIVPVGSKGGFVLKGELARLGRALRRLPGVDRLPRVRVGPARRDRQPGRRPGCNTLGGGPLRRRRPVPGVAADKGTAHLSDTANSVSRHYGFWLATAFASGGSVGLRPQEVGITAAGPGSASSTISGTGPGHQREAFTCVGIGDMAGDVFGTGCCCHGSPLGGGLQPPARVRRPSRTPSAATPSGERLFAAALELARLTT